MHPTATASAPAPTEPRDPAANGLGRSTVQSKKTVRVESPRTSNARNKAAEEAVQPVTTAFTSPRVPPLPERPSSHLPSNSKFPVPVNAGQAGPVPRRDPVSWRTARSPAVSERTPAVAPDPAVPRPSRAIGAIQRCIPSASDYSRGLPPDLAGVFRFPPRDSTVLMPSIRPPSIRHQQLTFTCALCARLSTTLQPYAHRIFDPLLRPATDSYDLNPLRQEPAAVLHSFVDPTYLPARCGSVNRAPSASLPLSSPVTMEYLAPGKRGAWLIPLSEGDGPVPGHTSKVVWPDGEILRSRSDQGRRGRSLSVLSNGGATPSTFLSKGRQPTESTTTKDSCRPPQLPLEWTDARLAVLWRYLTGLHEGRHFGPLRAQAIFGAGADVIKVNCDAHLALAIRGLLDRLSVKAVARRIRPSDSDERLRKVLEQGEGQQDDGDDDDDEKWLKGRALVWIDEQSRAILTA